MVTVRDEEAVSVGAEERDFGSSERGGASNNGDELHELSECSARDRFLLL